MADFSVDVDPIGDNVKLDEAIMDVLPPGCRVISTARGGKSLWVATLRIQVELSDGTEQVFFKKGASGDVGLNMMKGAFESEMALRSFIPEYVPRPIAYGTYKSRPGMHFYIADYVEMADTHPDLKAWATASSTLHKRSMVKSPEGKFGFHINTHLANIPQNNRWNSPWERFWRQAFRALCEKEEAARGVDDDFTRLKQTFLDIVVPRYLRPLESGGRVVRLTLLHNDGWPGNVKPRNSNTDIPCLFDSCAIWGHNEADMKVTRPGTWDLEAAGEEYREMMGVSEPREDYVTRVESYSTFGMVLRSAMYRGEPQRREIVMNHLAKLIDLVATSSALKTLPSPTQPTPDHDEQAGENVNMGGKS